MHSFLYQVALWRSVCLAELLTPEEDSPETKVRVILGIVQETAARESRRNASMGTDVGLEVSTNRPHKLSGVIDTKNHQIECLEEEVASLKSYLSVVKQDLVTAMAKQVEL